MLKDIKELVSGFLSRFESDRSLPLLGGSKRVQSSSDETETQLFYCPACEIVYIAIEKRTCSSCEGPVEPVPATLREAKDQ